MNKQPLVSVIVIFLNAGETFFEEAIASIFAQTYDNWELLFVDDGSTDISTQIAQKYAQQHPKRVRYLEHEGHQNRGMSASRNLGIRHAKGDYIALLDADDLWLPQKLERQVAILEAQPDAAMVYSSTWMWHSWTGNPEDAKRDKGRILGVQSDTLVAPPKLIKLFMTYQGDLPLADTPGTCSVLLRPEAIESVGGFEEAFRGMYEDQAFLYKICLKFPVFVESGCWDRYRQHPDSTCHVAAAQGHFNPKNPHSTKLKFLTWLEQYLIEQEFKDKEIWRLLQKALLPYKHPHLYRLLAFLRFLIYRTAFKAKRQISMITRQLSPNLVRTWLQAKLKPASGSLPIGKVDFGCLRRIKPIDPYFGYSRGLPIDRYYIEGFLHHRSSDIQGRVLEIGDRFYTQEFGGNRVTKSDVLHVKEGNPDATIVGDLTDAEQIPSDAFDCLVLTQTLHLIYDLRVALKTIYRILKPGGVALVTVPGISQISVDEWKDYWCWSFTPLSARRVFEEVFPTANVEVEAYGNVLSSISFLQGLAAEELKIEELAYHDPSYPMLITIRATKPEVTS